MDLMKVSVVIPAKNEAEGLKAFLPELIEQENIFEIIVVDDGSTDGTVDVCKSFGITVYSHPYSIGNGAAIKTGARKAKGDAIVFMDGDGQHKPSDISVLLDRYRSGFGMVVGARSKSSQASVGRWLANSFYNKFAGWMTGREIKDLTSGFRVVHAEKFREFLTLLPNGFSYPTTSTMAFFRAGYGVSYVPIDVLDRVGDSHIRLFKDGARFLLIIFKVGTLYSPLKLFLPISLSVFLIGLSYYGFTFFTAGRFTNMSALLFTTSLMIFMMGLISEQITNLLYSKKD